MLCNMFDRMLQQGSDLEKQSFSYKAVPKTILASHCFVQLALLIFRHQNRKSAVKMIEYVEAGAWKCCHHLISIDFDLMWCEWNVAGLQNCLRWRRRLYPCSAGLLSQHNGSKVRWRWELLSLSLHRTKRSMAGASTHSAESTNWLGKIMSGHCKKLVKLTNWYFM